MTQDREVRLGLRVPLSVRDGIKKLALFEGRTMAEVIVEAIEEAMTAPSVQEQPAEPEYRVLHDTSLPKHSVLIDHDARIIRLAS